jgi:hypothetical protein
MTGAWPRSEKAPTYHLEIKSTIEKCDEPFYISNNQVKKVYPRPRTTRYATHANSNKLVVINCRYLLQHRSMFMWFSGSTICKSRDRPQDSWCMLILGLYTYSNPWFLELGTNLSSLQIECQLGIKGWMSRGQAEWHSSPPRLIDYVLRHCPSRRLSKVSAGHVIASSTLALLCYQMA